MSDLCNCMPAKILATMLAMAQLGFLAGRSWKLHSLQQGVTSAFQQMAATQATIP